jgi:membrane protein involved in colicin uptake
MKSAPAAGEAIKPAHVASAAPIQQPQPNTSSAGTSSIVGGSKRVLPEDSSKSNQELSEKKLRRLEKNRLSARECRRRKREATEQMERQINLLEGENLRLRLQLQVS